MTCVIVYLCTESTLLAWKGYFNLWLLVSGKLETFVWLHSYLTPTNDLQINEIMSEKHSELLRERNQINARYHHYSHYVLLNFHTSEKMSKLLFPFQQSFTQVARSLLSTHIATLLFSLATLHLHYFNRNKNTQF